ncbi:VOC family protein [Streptomyces sp. NPDC005921]
MPLARQISGKPRSTNDGLARLEGADLVKRGESTERGAPHTQPAEATTKTRGTPVAAVAQRTPQAGARRSARRKPPRRSTYRIGSTFHRGRDPASTLVMAERKPVSPANDNAPAHLPPDGASVDRPIPEPLKGLGHVGLHVADLQGTSDWYQEYLGFEPAEHFTVPSLGARVQMMRVAGMTLELVELPRSDPHPRSWRPHVEALTLRGFGHLCFDVADCEAAFHRLRARGVEFNTGPKHWPELGFTNAHFHDNEGNDLEIISYSVSE